MDLATLCEMPPLCPAKTFRSKKCRRCSGSPISQRCFAAHGYFPAKDTIDTVPAYSCRFCEFASRLSLRSALRNTPPTSECPPSVCAEEAPQSGKRQAGKTSRLETFLRQWPPLNHGWLRL